MVVAGVRGHLAHELVLVVRAQRSVAQSERARGLEAHHVGRGHDPQYRAVVVLDDEVVDSGLEHVDDGVDGEAVSLPTPVVCSIRPGALRVRVPRSRPGATPPELPVNFARLRRLACWPFWQGGGAG